MSVPPPCLHSLPHCLSWKGLQFVVCWQDKRCLRKLLFHTHLWCFTSPSTAHLVAFCSFQEIQRERPSTSSLEIIQTFLKDIFLSNCFAFSLCCVPYPVTKLVNSFPAHRCSQIQVRGCNAPGCTLIIPCFLQPVALYNCK